MSDVPIVGVYRRCRRCRRWRRIGNYSVSTHRKRLSLGTVCHVCWRLHVPNARRAWWTVTDKGRAALREAAA